MTAKSTTSTTPTAVPATTISDLKIHLTRLELEKSNMIDNPAVPDRATKLKGIRKQIDQTKRQILEAETAEKIKAEEKTVKADRKSRTPRTVNAEGQITLTFNDGKTSVQADAKTARRWLRKHSLNVHNAVKTGSIWTLTADLPAEKPAPKK